MLLIGKVACRKVHHCSVISQILQVGRLSHTSISNLAIDNPNPNPDPKTRSYAILTNMRHYYEPLCERISFSNV